MARRPGRPRYLLRVHLLALSLMTAAAPAKCQLADAFAGHFGASRIHETGIKWSASVGVMLLTQFGSRWEPTSTDYWEYDQLQTTVGYNYATFGGQWSWPGAFAGGTPVLAGSFSGGITSDRLTRSGQSGLHDFRRFPHVQRATVDNGIVLYGGEVEASQWWRFHFWVVDVDLHPHVTAGWSSYHREVSSGAAVGVAVWKLRLQASAWKGWLYGQSGISPAAVGSRLTDGYWRFGGSLGFDRTRYGRMARYIPSVGVGVAHSSGIFVSEKETFLSLYFEFPFLSNDSFRLETVNDLLADKDRGPTGGLRLTYVAR